ncbi:MAG: hypothetical protein QXT47_05425 [Desulfurococcaceae archaeon]
MKAIDPVIATLILIAIAVIAGVFVLRQFITLGGTAGRGETIQVQDLAFIQRLDSQFNVYVQLSFTIKNTGGKPITVTVVEIPDLKPLVTIYPDKVIPNITLNVYLEPGQTYQFAHDVIRGIPHTPYGEYWEKGTEHAIVVKFLVAGNPVEQEVRMTARVS